LGVSSALASSPSSLEEGEAVDVDRDVVTKDDAAATTGVAVAAVAF
jgi:hypothetical protein